MTFEDACRRSRPWASPRARRGSWSLVALHSGYCLRRQYAAFAGVRLRQERPHFLDALVAALRQPLHVPRGPRAPLSPAAPRSIYRALGQEDNRNRRHTSPAH